MTPTGVDAWTVAMAAGERALAANDWSGGYAAFAQAHAAGHAVKRQHLAAHRGMIRAAAGARRYDRVVTNATLMTAAFLFDRGGA